MSSLPREPVEATVDGITHGGEGVARVEGKAVFVPGAIPGERLRVRVVDDRRRWARAELVEILTASPDRVEPPCPYAPRPPASVDAAGALPCGGCDLQHVAPEAQRRLKTRIVREQLERLGRIEDPPVRAMRAVGPDLRYRTRARFHAAPDGRLGFHAAGSHTVVPIDDCRILAPAPQLLREQVGDGTGAAEVTVRAHASTATAAVALEPGPGPLDLPEGDFDVLLAEVPITRGPQEQGTGPPQLVPVRGDGLLAEQIAAGRYDFDASTFFQVSPDGAQALVDQVQRAVGDVSGALVWDLYAGVGLFAVPLARAGADVVAVEGHATAADWASHNAARAGLDLEVVAAPVEDFLASRGGADGGRTRPAPDLVVVDPPRAGAGPDVCGAIADLLPGGLVYVACDVAALARDARVLIEHGYRLREAVPLDLFPMTHHVEVVASFAR